MIFVAICTILTRVTDGTVTGALREIKMGAFNMKLVNSTYSGSLLNDALSADYGISVIYTGEGTGDVPSYDFLYSQGFVIRRYGSSSIWIILMPFDGTRIAYNHYDTRGTWRGWRFIETSNQ